MNFDTEQITTLLQADNSHFRKIAFKTIVDNFDSCSRLFFDVILNDVDCDDLALNACQRFPSLNRGFNNPENFNPAKIYLRFAEYAAEHKLFLEKLKEYLQAETRQDRQKKLITLLSNRFEGLKSDLENTENNGDRQLMIFITGKCNLCCPYCFSNDLQREEMSLTDIEEILQWAGKNNIKRISLCGGEPSSHSHFDEILLRIKEHGFRTYFASNFTINCRTLKNFNAGVIDKIYVHITDQALKNPLLKEQVLKNIDHSKAMGIGLTYRTNISDNQANIAEWFRVMQETDIPSLNIAFTFPTKAKNNRFIDIDSFEHYIGIIEEIIRKSNELKVDLSFAKPIPLCIFDAQTSRYLLANKNYYPLCSIHSQNCTHTICITLQKKMHACLGITSSFITFHKDLDWQQIESYCINTVQSLFSQPLFKQCRDCFLFDRKLCQGSCLSYKSVL
jgi:organic radical activating enzyme